MLILAGRLFVFDRPEKRGARIVRTLARSAKRPWFAFGRIQSEIEATAGKFSAGFFSRRAGQRRAIAERSASGGRLAGSQCVTRARSEAAGRPFSRFFAKAGLGQEIRAHGAASA